MNILWISFIWPEPESSAAGYRTMQLIKACIRSGYEITMYSPCQTNIHQEKLASMGITTIHGEPNDSAFDGFIAKLNPDIVIFDRFMMEEQFGWRVRACCPRALRVIDTCDLHSLRRIRQKKIEKREEASTLSQEDLISDDSIRELAAIYRSDLSLIISEAEVKLLKNHYNVADELLQLCGFFYDAPFATSAYSKRNHFVTIGNFNHAPNVDSFSLLHEMLWGAINTALKNQGHHDVELHIYGAYPTDKFLKLDDPKSGFRVKGWAEDAIQTLSHYRVNLAPLRFGAGLKGKISDGWIAGTPCVATSIGAEGMYGELQFGGYIEDDWDRFVERAVSLYTNEQTWNESQDRGFKIISTLFSEEKNAPEFTASLLHAYEGLNERRARNFVGSMLWHNLNRSTEYFSRWIETKNKLKMAQQA